MDTIYRFTWTDKSGNHSTTVVGNREFNDQVAYITTLENAGLIWNASYTIEGKDI